MPDKAIDTILINAYSFKTNTQVSGHHLAVCENRWDMVGLTNGWELLGVEITLIWSVFKQDSEHYSGPTWNDN